MFEIILQYVNFGVLLIFGVFVSAAFCGVTFNKNSTLLLSFLSVILILIQVISFLEFGLKETTRIYPLISHLPLILVLVLAFKKRITASILSVTSAYLCCFIGKWIGLLTKLFLDEEWLFYSVRIVLNIIVGLILVCYISPLVANIFSKSVKTIVIFGILPITYYLYDLVATVYTDWFYKGNVIALEFLPFTLSIVYLIFCVLYFNEYEEKNELERQKEIVEIQAKQSIKEIEAIRTSAYETMILRHDMRHHLRSLYTYIKNENNEEALNYIKQTISLVEDAAVDRFCENELINAVLSYYKLIMEKQGIVLNANINIEKTLPCSEQEFSSILSNGLENAVNAVLKLEEEKRNITLLIKTDGGKLLLSVKNPCFETPEFSDGIPISKESGHGFGTQSIRYVTQKLNGNCQFTAENGIFSLRVVI